MFGQKTTCPITREQFAQHAKPIELVIDGVKQICTPVQMSTGSLGYVPDKVTIMIGGVPCKCQVGTIVLVNSKELPKDNAKPAA